MPSPSASSFPLISGVRSTYWAPATDTGGCSMPETSYVVPNALALGDMSNIASTYSIGNHSMCGQVRSLNCLKALPKHIKSI